MLDNEKYMRLHFVYDLNEEKFGLNLAWNWKFECETLNLNVL